ncbi:hypothetical protein TNCV_1441791 [Trichonephila clavipes]|uniref:Uncharacterized protein n=1 Tax=Trichonephila clavipes TaxID=2585209 RepID=A0A8X6RLP5_TRICX|nr:hypothetical protein TNCV_1441791 [Trichonephila clavipes]
MDDNARSLRTHIVDEFQEGADIRRMDCPSMSPDPNSIEYVWDGLGKILSQPSSLPRNPPPAENKSSVLGRMGFVAIHAY